MSPAKVGDLSLTRGDVWDAVDPVINIFKDTPTLVIYTF